MKRFNHLVLFFLFALTLVGSEGLIRPKDSIADESSEKEIVVYANQPIKNNKAAVSGLKTAKWVSENSQVYVVNEAELPEIKKRKAQGLVKAYSYNKKYKISLTPNDPRYSLSGQWGLRKISAPEAWDITTGNSEVKIAVIDTGFKLDHPDLSSKFVAGYDFVNNDTDPSIPAIVDGVAEDSYYHGTMVAGIAAAATNNSIGIAGVDWSAKIMPLMACDNEGDCYLDKIANAVSFAKNNGANVINLSLGGPSGASVLETAINEAVAAGVTVVAASGNDNLAVSYPAAYTNVIAVGATSSDDIRASFSNYGPQLDVVAPGVGVESTYAHWNGTSFIDGYATSNGTSFSAPYVSGLASLLLSTSDYSPAQIRDRIRSSADKVSGMNGENMDNYYGYGRINAHNALSGVVTTVASNSNISLNSFRVTMEDTSNPESYVLAQFPAIGEPVSVRPSLKNDNDYSIVLENLKIRGTLSSGTKFVVGAVPSLTLPANSITAVPVQSFNITSFYTHTFSIEYEVDGKLALPYVKPTYSYQQIKAHFPNIRVVKTPAFVPSAVDPYQAITGVYKIKNFDGRPAYLRSVMLRAELGKYLFYFKSDATKINPGEFYYYQASIIPFRQGIYDAYAHITYGNGSQRIPNSLLSTSSYSNFTVK